MCKSGKKIKEILKILGDKYTIKSIDWEWCIYRDLGSGYDIEVSGLDNRRQGISCTVFVWCLKERVRVVEKVKVSSLEALKRTLEYIENKYA